MWIEVKRSAPIKGTLRLPGDKSISHRAVLLGALAKGDSTCDNLLVAEVTRAMLDAVGQLGVACHLEGTRLDIHSPGLHGLTSPDKVIYCGHSGTTMRLLAGALSSANLHVTLDGSLRLRERPMARIVEPLVRMGAQIVDDGGRAPLQLAKRSSNTPLRGLKHCPSVASAQVKSAILLAGLQADGPTTLIEPGPSRDHTERMLTAMGADVTTLRRVDGRPEITLAPLSGRDLKPLQMQIPGDFSAAAFLLAAGAILPGSEIALPHVGLNWTRTGFLEALQDMGVDVAIGGQTVLSNEPVGDLRIRGGDLQGTHVSGDRVVRMIDEFPAFAVTAAFARGRTVVRAAGELRYKESDRILQICQGLHTLGVNIVEHPEGFDIVGHSGDLPGGVTLYPGQDHRMAMAFTLAGLRCRKPIRIDGAEIIHQSFPGFVDTLSKLGVGTIVEGYD
jgi:3-phosphoshikimate 1-carboxyvinyltransferase